MGTQYSDKKKCFVELDQLICNWGISISFSCKLQRKDHNQYLTNRDLHFMYVVH